MTGEAVGLVGLAAERLDDERTVERLVRDRADVAAERLRVGDLRRQPALVEHVDAEQGREHDQAHDREHDVGQQHRDHGGDEHRDHADRHGQRHEHGPGRLDVGVGVGEQLAGGVTVVPCHRERQVATGDASAVLRDEAEVDDAAHEAAGDDAERAEHRDRHEQQHGHDEGALNDLAALERRTDDVVRGPAEHPGVGDRGGAEHDAADDRDREQPPLLGDATTEQAESSPHDVVGVGAQLVGIGRGAARRVDVYSGVVLIGRGGLI